MILKLHVLSKIVNNRKFRVKIITVNEEFNLIHFLLLFCLIRRSYPNNCINICFFNKQWRDIS